MKNILARLKRRHLFFKQKMFLFQFTPENSSRYIQDELEKAGLTNEQIKRRIENEMD
jgi:hypothetical protein